MTNRVADDMFDIAKKQAPQGNVDATMNADGIEEKLRAEKIQKDTEDLIDEVLHSHGLTQIP